VVTYLQDGVWGVDIYRGMRQVLPVGEIKHGDAFIGLELAEHFSNQRRAGWAERFWCLQAHQPRERGDICLPATPDDRVALAHQEAVAWIKSGCGIEGPWSTIKIRQDCLASAIHHIEQEAAIPALGEERLQHGEMGRKAYPTRDITGRQFDVRNGSVAGMKWIDYKVDYTFEPLIRPHIPKRSALQKRAPMCNV
jgi:hypothetical protein